jgi:uncharacterized SAM-binding protein YcdF (DUF218 family)
MFFLLTQVLLWLLVILVVYNLLTQWIPKDSLAFLGSALLLILIVLAFFVPNDPFASSAWSILSLPIKPFGLVLVLLIMAFSNAIQKIPPLDDKEYKRREASRRTVRNLSFIALLILWLCSTPFLVDKLAQQAELEFLNAEAIRQKICTDKCPVQLSPADETAGVIVVLGQGTTKPRLPPRRQIQLTELGDRLLYAAEVYRDQLNLKNNPSIIVCAGYRPELEIDLDNRDRTIEAYDIAKVLTKMRVPETKIIDEPRGKDIYRCAEEVRAKLTAERLGDRVLLVTSAINMYRAKMTFEHWNIKVLARPTDFYTIQPEATPKPRIKAESFVPNPEALWLCSRIWDEYLTTIYYFLRGWLEVKVV